MTNKELAEWHKIRDKLTNYFNICPCQRKIKSIIISLVSIHDKCIASDYNFTGAEWLLIAIMDSKSTAIVHGINCEYPILMHEDPFWKWVMEVKDSPYLKDN